MRNRSYGWIVGTNMPGYMPDSDPAEFTNWRDAHISLLDAISRDMEETEIGSDAETDISETLGRATKIKRCSEFSETVNNRHYWLTRV